MHLVIELSISMLRLVGLLLVLALGAAAFSTARRVYQFTTWLNDVKGPVRTNYIMGHYAEFYKSDIVRVCLDWTTEFGGAVRHMAFLGEPRLLLTDPAALEHILVKHPYAYTKQPDFARFLVMLMGPGLLAAEGDQHRRQKKAIQAGFAPQSVRAYYPIFLHHARQYRQRLLDYIEEEQRVAKVADKETRESDDSVLIDILKPSARVSVDILGHAGFGQPFRALDRDDQFGIVKSSWKDPPLAPADQPLMRAFDALIETASVCSAAPWRMAYDVAIMFVPWLVHLPFTIKHHPHFKKARRVMDAEAERVLENAKEAEQDRVRNVLSDRVNGDAEQRPTDGSEKNARHLEDSLAPIEQSPHSPASIVAFMMRTRELTMHGPRHRRLTAEDLYGQVTTLMLAGHETTSTVLAWVARGLSQNLKGQDKLRAAICEKRAELGLTPISRTWSPNEGLIVPDDDTDVDAGRELTFDEVESITYLDWAAQEMMRLYSPVHTSSRTATADEVLPIDPEYSPSAPASGIRIHKGVTIIIPIEAINRDPKLWGPDAEEYRPERWADDTLPGVRRFRAQKGGMSFMFGPRGCIGMRFSMAEIKAILTVLLPALRFVDSKRPVVRSRWIVARPWDPQACREQCPVRIAKVH